MRSVQRKTRHIPFSAVFFLLVLIGTPMVFADEFTSTNYKLLDPVVAPSGYGTSAGFQLWGSLGELGIGTSSSASFNAISGFLTFPVASSPVISSTAGNAQVSLSWTASQGVLGWTPTTYSVGQSTTGGGAYTYTNVGGVLLSTQTGLTNGTTYYFIVVVNDAFGNAIATSTEISSTPSGTTGGGGGGGGGGGTTGGGSSIAVSGRAYPNSTIYFYQNNREILRTVSGPDAKFSFSKSGLSEGNYTFSVVAVDPSKKRSPAFSIPVTLPENGSTEITGVFLAPLLSTDYEQIKQGDTMTLFGVTVPDASVAVQVNSEVPHFFQTPADEDGVYLLQFNSSILELGKHTAKSQAQSNNVVSPFSNLLSFKVGSATERQNTAMMGDLSKDGRVNLYDFSIAAYWYQRALVGEIVTDEVERLNGDGKINLVDFSIIAYYWTN